MKIVILLKRCIATSRSLLLTMYLLSSLLSNASSFTVENEDGIAIDFEIEGDYPKYGNDDDRVDSIAKEILQTITSRL